MSCETERAALDSADAAADNAKIDSEAARAKALNNTEAAAVACGGEWGAGVVGGAVVGGFLGAAVGGIAAGVVCMAGLYAARNSVIDAQAAEQKYENASSAAGRAFSKYYLCMERNRRR